MEIMKAGGPWLIHKVIHPKTYCVSFAKVTMSNVPQSILKLKDILPPEGTLRWCQMRDFILIVRRPNELDPRYLNLVVEFIQMLQQ
jgi:hypothetical protein